MIEFQISHKEEIKFRQKDLIQLFPFGLSVHPKGDRPFLLLKDNSGNHTLPVAVNPLEAGMTLNHTHPAALPSTPHRFTSMLMKSLKIQPTQCVFVQIKGLNQWVRLYFKGHPEVDSLKLKADEAMSLCLHLNIPLYATEAFIEESKVMNVEIQNLHQDIRDQKFLMVKDHAYLM